MKILLATYDGYSHVMTAFPLVKRLILRGHTVRWLVDKSFRVMVERAGATLVPTVYTPSHAAVPAQSLQSWQAIFQREALGQASDLIAALEDEPADVLLIDPTMLGVSAMGPGYPDTTIGMLGCVPLLHCPREVAFVLQATLPACELPVPDDLRSKVFFTGPLLPPPMDELSPQEQRKFADRIPTDKPLVLITHGTLATDLDKLAQPALDAIAELPVFAIVQARPGNLRLPKNALELPWIPFGRLLPHAALMVSNGGYQGAQWCLAAGVPMVIHGHTEDKPQVGERVEWAGYGTFVDDVADLQRGIETVLLNPRYREQARRLAQQAALQDSATLGAQILEMHGWKTGAIHAAA